MADLPRLFDDKGRLLRIDEAALDPASRGRFDAIRTAYQANEEADAAVKAAFSEVDAALAAVANTEEFFNAHWPRQSFHDLWKENFSGGPRNRMAGIGRI